MVEMTKLLIPVVLQETHKKRRIIMPEFGSPFSGLANNRKLTDQELIRAIRFMIAAEYEAIQLYMQLAESTDNKLAKDVLQDIADEERVHAGEFLRLLHELDADEKTFYAEGAKEVEEEIKKLKKKKEK
jgi:rubrerythrin